MKRFAIAFTLMAFTLTGIVFAADDKALKELEGTYKIAHAEKAGKVAPKEFTDPVTVVIKGDEFIVTYGADDKKVAKIKVNGEAKPATIDLNPTDGELKGNTLPGIYKLEKGELTIVVNEKGDRPKEFKSEDDVTLLKLKKVEK